MMTESELKVKGLEVLTKALGAVEAEKFVALILREPFDYTKWQRQLWPRKTVEELSMDAMRYRRSMQRQKTKPTRRNSGSTRRGKPRR